MLRNVSKQGYLLSGNLLERTSDDEISVVHGNKISCELTGKVVLVLKFLPIHI